MPSPLVQVRDGAGAYQPTTNGVNVTPGNTVTVNLLSAADVQSWLCDCLYTDELSDPAAVTASLVIDAIAKTATFTAPVAGRAYIFRSRINGGIGPDGQAKPSYTTTFGIFTTTAGGARVLAANETLESNPLFGWIADVNAVIRNPSGGGGGTTPTGTGLRKVSGGTENPAASLLVDADVSASAAIAVSKLAIAGSTLALNAGRITGGSAPAASSFIGLSYAAADTVIGAKDSGGTDRQVLARIGAEAWQLGAATTGAFNWTWNAAALTINAGGACGLTAAAAVGIVAGTTCNLTAGSGYSMSLNVGNATYLYLEATGQTIQTGKPVKGFDFAANLPFRWAKAIMTPTATNAMTLTQAQYSCPMLLFKSGGGVTGPVTVTMPNIDGEPHIVKNRCGFNVVIGGVTIATGTDAHISYDSDAAAWGRCT